MARSIRWRDLAGGLAALVAIVALSLVILIFGNVNSLHGKTVRVYAAVGAARGVLRGTEVWLYGRRVGIVNKVVFAPPSAEPGVPPGKASHATPSLSESGRFGSLGSWLKTAWACACVAKSLQSRSWAIATPASGYDMPTVRTVTATALRTRITPPHEIHYLRTAGT